MAKQAIIPSKQAFRFTAPDATSVLLVGDFTRWQSSPIPMKKESNGIWSVTVELTPGKHTYRFIVDGEWCDDPDCSIHVANPYGSEDMVRTVA